MIKLIRRHRIAVASATSLLAITGIGSVVPGVAGAKFIGTCGIVTYPTIYRHTSCPGADLSRANLHATDLFLADLIGANLTHANLSAADLTRADLAQANLNHANVQNADLFAAKLTGADLRDADLREAQLFEANLKGANLAGANLHLARFCHTTMPDGSVRNSSCGVDGLF